MKKVIAEAAAELAKQGNTDLARKLVQAKDQELFDVMSILRGLGKSATPHGFTGGPVPVVWEKLSKSDRKKVKEGLTILDKALKERRKNKRMKPDD